MSTTNVLFVSLCAVALLACGGTRNHTALTTAPNRTLVQFACIDANGDHHVNAADVTGQYQPPDFDGDGKRDADDAAFFQDIDLSFDPDRQKTSCDTSGEKVGPEYLVARGDRPATVDCTKGNAVLLIGIGGGIVNLDDVRDAAGIRSMVDGVLREYKKRNTQTISIIAGPEMSGAMNIHTSMEQWLAHAARVYLQRYPCLHVAIIGHSHGAVSGDVLGANLERDFAPRIVEVVDVDRRQQLYTGDIVSRPKIVHVFNIFETNDAEEAQRGSPYDSPNAENWDANAEQAPENGDMGGRMIPVMHQTIDNSESVKQRVIADVISHSP